MIVVNGIREQTNKLGWRYEVTSAAAAGCLSCAINELNESESINGRYTNGMSESA